MNGPAPGPPTPRPALLEAALGDYGNGRSAPLSRLGSAWMIGLASHVVLLGLALQSEPSLENWAARMAALIHEDLASHAPVLIDPTPEPEEVPEPEPVPAAPDPVPAPEPVPPPAPEPVPLPEPSTELAPPEPAASGAILAASPPESAPLDFTDDTFVTGTATSYAGGVSAASGTSTSAVRDTNARPNGLRRSRNRSRARPVQLAGDEWDCAWPQEAVSEDIFEQHVTLKVQVSAAGTVSRVTLLSDPGLGFGPAAELCASEMRFSAARNEEGQPIDAQSPPIRVRFTR